EETLEVTLPAGKLAHTDKVMGPFDSGAEPPVVFGKVAADHGQVERPKNRGGRLALEEEDEAPPDQVLDRLAIGAAAPAFQALLGMHRESLVGSYAQDADWLVLEAPEGPMSVHPVTVALKSRQSVHGVLARTTRPDGSDVWIQVDAVADIAPSGEVARVVASIT